jgi:hypothetical protein
MARRSAGWRTTGAGSATLPIASLMAPASNPLWLVEVGCVNTTTTAVAMTLRRIVTSAGTAGTAQTAQYEEENVGAAVGNPVDTHTVAPTFATGFLRVGALGASIGSGVIWTFGGRGLFIPSAVTNGVCLVPWTGATGQICDVYFVWDA